MEKFRVEQIAPDLPLTWALTERFLWSQEVNDVLKKDADGALLAAAYAAVDWEAYYERLKDTPFYNWAVEGGDILTFGGPYHIEADCFFSGIGDTSIVEEDWLKQHPEFNQLLHDIHVETAGQMIDYILGHGSKKRGQKRRRSRPKAQSETTRLKVGDSVVVKPGTLDPDFGVEIGGWQGRLAEDRGADDMILIAWDSITLQNMPDVMIEQSEEQGFDWTKMVLEAAEVEPTPPRDGEQDVARIVEVLSGKHAWAFLGEAGRRIGKVLAGVDPDDEMALLETWEDHLTRHLVFPFEADVAVFQDRGPLQAEDRVKVTGIALVDDLYGVIVDLRHGRHKYAFPLCDLEVVDQRSLNFQLARDYAVWFANR